MVLEVDFHRAVVALSDALDLVGVDVVGHGLRVGLMGEACASQLQWDDTARNDLLLAGLLHDCGVSTTREHRHLVNELDWSGSDTHCDIGARYLAQVPMLARLAPVVREHHSHWRSLLARDIPMTEALPANLIYLVDRVDALHATGHPPEEIGTIVSQYAGDFFCRELIEAYRTLAVREAFWYAQEEPALHERIIDLMGGAGKVSIDFTEFRALATTFSHIIDAKSPHTERHSAGVAQLSRLLGRLAGMDQSAQDDLELAGLLHDIGKLRVPDEVLDKSGPLTVDERKRMTRHAFDTFEILRHIFGENRVVRWAALHHEALSGHGYPFHLGREALPFGARVVAVADVFQALAQHRPYRAPLPLADIARHLDEMVATGHLDGEVVTLVQANLNDCWLAAIALEATMPREMPTTSA